ncbi:MAG: VaFE repeat-containing surface-anchored protein, partial [Anaerovoracaceae bacterium]|nr:VaFE repeat-containing surface-anchored protein [Anaerovoracaceae bacterium]
TGSDGEKVIGADKKVTIVDTVTYENLTPGKEYTLKGTLMNKDTGKALTVDGKKVTAEKTFTPEKKSGTVKMTFNFDARDLEGVDIVVFEKLYLGSKLVAKHTDINDEGQTVTLLPSQNPTSPAPPDRTDVPVDVPRTGDSGQRVLYLLLIALSMGFLSMVFALERRYEKHE